jgi:hypothetical protein
MRSEALINYSFMKGRLAEAIIERLFISLGMDVYPVGFEAQLPRLARLKASGKLKSSAITKFEYGPDFIVCDNDINNKGENEAFEVEVKFRSGSNVSISELEKYDSESLIFLFINKENIYCIENKDIERLPRSDIELKNGKKIPAISFDDCILLEHHNRFGFNRRQRDKVKYFSALINSSLNHFASESEVTKKLIDCFDGDKKKLKDACERIN